MRPKVVIAAAFLLPLSLYAAGIVPLHLGRQPDRSFLVSTDQRIEPGAIAFDGRPIDLALHPSGKFVAVLNQNEVFLADKSGVLPGSAVKLGSGASYRGILWAPDGKTVFASVGAGYVQEIALEGTMLKLGPKIEILPPQAKGNPVPGGMAITRDGRTLFVAAANRNAAEEIDLNSRRWAKEWPVQNIPFDVTLSPDEKTLAVSNWGGRFAKEADDDGEEEETGPSGPGRIVVDRRGVSASGTVSIIRRDTGRTETVDVGLHPTGIAVQGDAAYVANSGSDSISVIDLNRAKVRRVLPIRWGGLRLFGSMPGALAVRGDALYACNGGDNALCEIDLKSGKVKGFRPAGFYPTGVAISPDGALAFVVNTKGNGSVRKTLQGLPGNAHDFQGTVSVIDLKADLDRASRRTAEDNNWNRSRAILRPKLKVYGGAIRHVLYIIKENRTYDEILGDMPEGNGDPKLCGLGREITPNHHALAREFTLFDNSYVSGTNSAEGHQWTDEALANDYIERFYADYSRSYPYDGTDAMALSSGGMIWDAAAKKGKTIRVYGEFASDHLAKITPKPGSWLDTWKDRLAGTRKYKVSAQTTVNGLKKYLHPEVICWPLLVSDQWRADKFIEEYRRFSREGKVPNLMVMSLPCDHTEGADPRYPKPRSMVADNDLALGRIVEAVSHSPEWKETCIIVTEDDAQAGPDHVDGHRAPFFVISPYTRRKFVDSSLYTHVTIVRSIELMLGLDPMNKFDAVAVPFTNCFTDAPDLTPYQAKPNRVPLDDMNPQIASLRGKERYWAEKSVSLDWSGIDKPDWYWLNRIVWHSLHGVDVPYPN
jgi:DNA-binding beta-propeller fold protein YncE